MDELKFRAVATAVLKEANSGVLDELDIDVLVSEAVRSAGPERIKDCPGPLRSFKDCVEYAKDVTFEEKTREMIMGARDSVVVELMWGMPNWLCVTDYDCWDCFREFGGELGNRTTTYLHNETKDYIKIRIDGLYAILYKHNGARGYSEKSFEEAKKNMLLDMVLNVELDKWKELTWKEYLLVSDEILDQAFDKAMEIIKR